MSSISNTKELKAAIQLLEIKQTSEWHLLKEKILKTTDSLKLVNILRSAFTQVVSSPDLKSNIASSVVGLLTGFVAKKVLVGTTRNPLTKLLGIIVEIAVANKVVKNSEEIKLAGNNLLKRINRQ